MYYYITLNIAVYIHEISLNKKQYVVMDRFGKVTLKKVIGYRLLVTIFKM